MILVSQDKDKIINFDNIIKITILDNAIVMFDSNYNPEYYCSDVLGVYATRTRAKEVLQEITEFWKYGAMTDCKGFICYEMPEK